MGPKLGSTNIDKKVEASRASWVNARNQIDANENNAPIAAVA